MKPIFFPYVCLKNWIWMIVWILIVLFSGINALKDVKVAIPHAVKVHETVTLQCNYDLEDDILYTVKWYKGQKEFFRFIPKESPNIQVFALPGFNIDVVKSSANKVILRNVQPEVTGRFRCEVSTDAPNFYTVIQSGFMYVVDVPKENPIMQIEKEELNYGYLLKANCTTPPAFPPMNISWYINGVRVNESSGKKIGLDPEHTHHKNQRHLYMTVSFLEKEIDDSIFQGGVIRIRCASTLFNLYKGEDIHYIDENNVIPSQSSVIGNAKAGSGSTHRVVPPLTAILVFLIRCFPIR